MVRNELSPQSNFSNHCIFTKTRPGAGFSQCELNPDSLPARARCRNMPHSSAMCRTAVLRGAGDLHSSGAASSAAHGASLAIACGGPSF